MSRQINALIAGELWSPHPHTGPQTIRLDNNRIVSISPGTSPSTGEVLDASDALVVPGLVDIQNNGGLGWSFQAADRANYAEIARFYLVRGTTTLLPTLVTADADTLAASLEALAEFCQGGGASTIAGIHLEGPFLSPAKSGAHDPAALCLPDVNLMRRFLSAAGGYLKIVSLAPELPGALELIRLLSEQGILVSAAHSAATYEQIRTANLAGLRFMTHLGNASDWPHREMNNLGFLGSEPGFVGAFLAIPELGGSIILDGFHFHPALLEPLVRLKSPERVVLVSDASSVTGLPPGVYQGGGLSAEIHPEGFATSGRGGGWLAGSIITLLEAVQRAVRLAGLPIEQALSMATLTPARWIGLAGRKGEVIPGADADLLVLNRDLSLRWIIAGGQLQNDSSG